MDLIKKEAEQAEFNAIIFDLINNDTVKKMKKFRQHCNTDCFSHCYEAAYYCYKICKKLNLDYVSAVRGAMLHDLFLYDWRVPNGLKGFHAFHHGMRAYENARKIFDLNDTEKDMIINHMWPVTIRLPKTREGLILTFVDKYCASKEIIKYYMLFIKNSFII